MVGGGAGGGMVVLDSIFHVFLLVVTESHEIFISFLAEGYYRPVGWAGGDLNSYKLEKSMYIPVLLRLRGKIVGSGIPFQDRVCCNLSCIGAL